MPQHDETAERESRTEPLNLAGDLHNRYLIIWQVNIRVDQFSKYYEINEMYVKRNTCAAVRIEQKRVSMGAVEFDNCAEATKAVVVIQISFLETSLI
jgi:hypothetical protein